jgi:N-dimethylarginine dimethylaminohydrolase
MRSPTKPGDLILDRYLSGADESKREAARAQWKRLVRALLKVATRIALEEETREVGDSPNSDRRLKIPSLP